MTISVVYEDIEVQGLIPLVQKLKAQQWRFVQILAVNLEDACDIQYSFMKGAELKNFTIRNHSYQEHVPSITAYYFSAFVFENEIHDLFGVQIDGIALDFQGHFYDTLTDKPMSVISPEQKAAREKAKKLAEAKRKKEEAARAAAQASTAEIKGEGAAEKSSESACGSKSQSQVPKSNGENTASSTKEPTYANPLDDPKIQAKLAKLPPEKAEKLKAALLAQAKKGE